MEKSLNYIAQLENLEVLLLRNNKLKTLPQNLKDLTGLEVLELSGNDFSKKEQERIKAFLPDTNVVF